MVAGDGGRGAHIILKGNSQLWTLLHLRYFKNVLAENGENGSLGTSTGKTGKDIIIEVPLGTIARDEETGKWWRNFRRWPGDHFSKRRPWWLR